MQKPTMYAVRNPNNDPRLFACTGKPVYRYDITIDNYRWFSESGKWIELPSTWREDITFETSPRRIRSIQLHRKQ